MKKETNKKYCHKVCRFNVHCGILTEIKVNKINFKKVGNLGCQFVENREGGGKYSDRKIEKLRSKIP